MRFTLEKVVMKMKDFKKIIAGKIKNGENVALYCYGIYASHLICYLEKFYGVKPAVVIDNDLRKKGLAEFDIPVMPFDEAKGKYDGLNYYICSDDFKFAIIGDMLEKGVKPENILNYVPVEKKRTCLYFQNRLLLLLGTGEDGTQLLSHCHYDGIKSNFFISRVPIGNGSYESLEQIIDKDCLDFENENVDACKNCAQNRVQYAIAGTQTKKYKQVNFFQEHCGDCVFHCDYCCVGGNKRSNSNCKFNSLDSYAKYCSKAFSLGRIEDDFSYGISVSERDFDKKVEVAVKSLKHANLNPMIYNVFSVFSAYSENLAELLRNGLTVVVWSLDAGTRETFKKIKQVDVFDRVIENAKKYIAQDAFGGNFIVAKYLIVKGMNDNDKEYDAYLDLVKNLGLKYVSLDFDFNLQADESDIRFIQKCYEKIIKNRLLLTYKNTNGVIPKALNMNYLLNLESLQGVK
jgi:hypothetical protein